MSDLHDEAVDAIAGPRLADSAQLRSLYEEVAIADAVYEASAREMAQACLLHQRDIVAFERESDHFKPAFATAIRPDSKQILLIVRGTQTLTDALTNLTGAASPPYAAVPAAGQRPDCADRAVCLYTDLLSDHLPRFTVESLHACSSLACHMVSCHS